MRGHNNKAESRERMGFTDGEIKEMFRKEETELRQRRDTWDQESEYKPGYG